MDTSEFSLFYFCLMDACSYERMGESPLIMIPHQGGHDSLQVARAGT